MIISQLSVISVPSDFLRLPKNIGLTCVIRCRISATAIPLIDLQQI